jgi:F-type H+-transporting ATPase subunit b
MKDKIVNEARDKAKAEYEKIAADSRAELENQKNEAKAELKTFAGDLALQIAERVIKKELKEDKDQKEYVAKLLSDLQNQRN